MDHTRPRQSDDHAFELRCPIEPSHVSRLADSSTDRDAVAKQRGHDLTPNEPCGSGHERHFTVHGHAAFSTRNGPMIITAISEALHVRRYLMNFRMLS